MFLRCPLCSKSVEVECAVVETVADLVESILVTSIGRCRCPESETLLIAVNYAIRRTMKDGPLPRAISDERMKRTLRYLIKD